MQDILLYQVVNHHNDNIYSPIFYAIEIQFCRLVRRLLQYVDADKITTNDGYNILHHAARYAQPGSNGESGIWAILLEENNPRHNVINEMYMECYDNSPIGTPLHQAASAGNVHSVRFLYEKGNKFMTTKDSRGWTPLHHAAAKGSDEVIDYIVNEDVRTLMAIDNNSHTPLAIALSRHTNVELLLNLGVPLHDTITTDDINKSYGTTLCVAVRHRNLNCVRTLHELYGVSLTTKDLDGKTPLHYAAEGRDEIIHYIVKKDKTTLVATDGNGKTPLAIAIISNKNVELLLRELRESLHEDITTDDINKSYGTTLCVAAKYGNLKCVRTLHELYGVSLTTKDLDGKTPLHYAAEGRDEIIHYIVEKDKTTLVATDGDGNTPLAIAIISNKNVELLLRLLRESLHEDITTDDINKSYGTILCLAAKYGNLKCVRTLHELYGVSLTTKDSEGKTPLHYAVLGRHEIIRYIVEKDKTTLTTTDDNGYTSLAIAINRNIHSSTVELLLHLGAHHLQVNDLKKAFFNKNNSDIENNWTVCNPLKTAVIYGKLETVEILCNKYNALLTINDHEGWTLLHYAAAKGRDDMINFIVGTLGLSKYLEATDNNDHIPLAIAIINNNDSSIKLLLHHTAINHRASYSLGRTMTNRISDQLYGPTIRLAAEHGYIECVKFIHQENNELLSTKDDKGWTPLHYAATHGSDKVIRYIVHKNSKTLKAKDNMGNTPLITAIVYKNESNVKLLLELGASLGETISKEAQDSLPRAETPNGSNILPTETFNGSDIPLAEIHIVSDIPPVETSNLSSVASLSTYNASLVENDCNSFFTQLFYKGDDEKSALQLILDWWNNEKLAKDLLDSCIKGNVGSKNSTNCSESHVQLNFKILRSADGRWFNFVHLLQERQELFHHPVTESLVWQNTQDVKYQIFYNSVVHCVCLWFFMLQINDGYTRYDAVGLPFLFFWLIFVYIQDLHEQARRGPLFFISAMLFCSIFAAIVLTAFKLITSELVIPLSKLLFLPAYLRMVSYYDRGLNSKFLHMAKAVLKFLMIAVIAIFIFAAFFMIKLDLQDPLNGFGKTMVSKTKIYYSDIVDEITFETMVKVITGLTAVGSFISKMELNFDWIKKYFEDKNKTVGEAIYWQATVLESVSRSYFFYNSYLTTSIKVYHDRKLDNKKHGSFIFGNRIWECVSEWYVNQYDPERQEDKIKFMEAKGIEMKCPLHTCLCEVKYTKPINKPTGQ